MKKNDINQLGNQYLISIIYCNNKDVEIDTKRRVA